MNYGGSMPDWHQYNPSQTNEVTQPTQNVNSGHLGFIPGVGPPSLNAISLNTEGLNKHQNDANFNARNYQAFNNVTSGPNIPNNSPLASMVQMQNCIGHYGSPNTRNPMLDNINTSVDPRNTAVGAINNEIGYRSNQVSFNGPIGHLSGSGCNLNASSGTGSGPGPIPGPRTNSGSGLASNSGNGTTPGSMFGPGPRHRSAPGPGQGSGPGNMGPRNASIGSVQPPGKPAPSSSFIPCKGLCCNSDPNINYQQWDKYGSYQNNASYGDNVHPSGYQMDNRHYANNCNFRKDNLEGKEVMGPALPNASGVDHRRNFADYKYHKEHLAHRNYSTSSGMFHNYPMQSYNYSAEHQKYPYPTKEHTKTNNMNMSNNAALLKQQEQNFLAQQKFGNKQFQYQNGNMMPKGVPTLNVNPNMASSPQNPYFNPQFPRNISAEISPECQETSDNNAMVNRMQSSFMHGTSPQHQTYQHKIAMQKFSMENHLRELSRIPGYQSHPKYKECVLRYREVLKLQQTAGYQNPVQQASRLATPVNTGVPPINLQFDQNGMLINSSYIQDGFSKLQHASNVEQIAEGIGKQNKDQVIAMDNKCQQSQQPEQLMIQQPNEHVPSNCAETLQKQNEISMHKDFNQNQLKVQTSESHTFDTLGTDTSNETLMQQKASKEFTKKPDLDVRQFLANWDETDDEEETITDLPDAVLNETTPVVVVSYENVDVSSKKSQSAEASRRPSFCSNESLKSNKQGEESVITAQDCLTISYSSPDNAELATTTKRTIGEGVVKPGSIIHCISNGPDEIPTIHIVDNLEISNILGASNDQTIQTLEKQKTISFFRETSSTETEEMSLESTEQQEKDDTRVLSAHYSTSLDDGSKDNGMEVSNISETIQATTVLAATGKSNLDAVDNMELKKQHSFEESHNPDDISLPDLPTSECTPISTTLNTPIHSDTEESSQNMEDLSISTNPIEVMQNSPVISFTQLNSEEKVKNSSLGNLTLEFQKDNRYKSNEANSTHEQEVSLVNFNFSNSSRVKSTETRKSKQVKSLGTHAVRKKVFLVDGKESDTSLAAMEYELDSRQEEVEGERNLERRSPSSILESRRKSIDSNVNLTPTESDDESHHLKSERELFRRKRIKKLTVSTNTNSEADLSTRKKGKEATTWEDKCVDKYLAQKRDTNCSRQSKSSDSGSSQGGEHSVCHMTSRYKHYSVAVIKDNVNLSDKRSQGTADSFRMNCSSTKGSSAEPETKRQISSKAASTLQESIQSQTSRLLQKDLKTVDGDVRYTAEEIRLLKEYRKKKEKLQNNEIKSRGHSLKPVDEESQKVNDNSLHHRNKLESSQINQGNEILAAHKVCLEQNSVSSIVSLNSENLETQEDAKGHSYMKNLTKSTDFGIQLANVNLKIKDSDVGKELILGEKGQEHKEGIKIEINVSCTDRTSKGQDQNKRSLYDDLSLYEIDESLSYSNTLDGQRRLYCKDLEDNPKLSEKSNLATDAKNDTESNLSATLKKSGRPSLESNEETSCNVSRETLNSFNKSSRNNVSSKDAGKTEVIEATNFSTDHGDIIKSKSAISNTAIVDTNNKVKADWEDNCMQSQGSTSMNEEVASVSHSKISKKLPQSNLVELSTKSLNSLKNLDLGFEKVEYKKSYGLNSERGHRVDDESEDDGYTGKWKKPKIDIFEDCDMFQSTSGYVNPIFSSIDKLKDLHTVPVYTTKDGKISYSPNRRFTYHELMLEARKREACSSGRKSHNADTWNSYYNSKFRKLYKKKRHHGLSERKNHEYKDTKYLYDRKRNYSDEFCSRSHVKYKDYVHSIRNNNAVWSDHCNKVDKMYSSSDSDDEIVDRSKNQGSEVSSFKKSQVVEHKTVAVSKSDRNDIVTGELDLEEKNKVDDVADIRSNEGKDVNLEETLPIQPEIITEVDKSSQDRESDNSNCKDNLDPNVQSQSIRSNNEKENVECSVGESSTLDNLKIVSENLERDETKNNECINLVVDKAEDKIVVENGAEDSSTTNELLHSNLLSEEPLLNEENHEEKTDNEESLSKEAEVTGEEVSVNDSKENDSKNIEQAETSENLEIDRGEGSELKPEETKELTELQGDCDDNIEHILQESSELGISNNISAGVIEEFERNIDLPEGNDQFSGKIKISNEEKGREENTEEENRGNIEITEHQNDNSSTNESSPKKSSEEPDSQTARSDEAVNQKNDTEEILSGNIEHVENKKVTSDEADNDVNAQKENFPGFSKDEIPNNESDNITKNEVAPDTVESDDVPSSIEETTIEPELITENLNNENAIDDLPTISEQETNPSRDSSIEKEMPVLNMYCTIKHSSTDDPEVVKNKVEEEEKNVQKEKQGNSLEQEPCKSSSVSPNTNTDLVTIPKLVIKRTDGLSSKSEISSLDHTDSSENKYDAKLLSEVRPKIPKMIIVKNRSRSVTPTIEILEKNKPLFPEQNDESMVAGNSDSESYTLKYNNYENKVPKVKIKLEDISSKDLKLYLKRKAAKKNVPRVKIKKSRTQENKKFEMEDSSGTETSDSDEEDKSFQESMNSDTDVERIPKLKLKRQEESISSSPDRSRAKDSNNSKVTSKRIRRTKEEDSKHSAKCDGNATISEELKRKYPQCNIEKIPKVIIKRTQIGAEFKCEISKRKKSSFGETSKWQPKVKLQRLQLLDHMVKDLKQSKITLKDTVESPTRVKGDINDIKNGDSIHDGKVKLCRSNSASSLSAVKCKQRRLSDTDYMKVTSKSGAEVDNSLGADKVDDSETNNLKQKIERELFFENKQVDRNRNDESENEATKHSFKNILLKEENDSMVVKKEYSSFGTKESTPVVEDKFLDAATRSRNYGNNDNSIIKVDSSDESQTTIEILPASPDSSEDEGKNSEFENNNGINTDGAIPTQLELELELIDNTNMRAGIVASKISNYASHSKNKYSNEGSVKAYFSGFQCSSRNKFDQNEDSSLEEQQSLNSEKKSNGYFYCNDLLVKEVLAAKEALKKCLTRSETEDADGRKSKPRTVAEKKQGSSFCFKDLGKPLGSSEESHSNNDNDKLKTHTKSKTSESKGDVEKRCSKPEKLYSVDYPTASTFGESSVPEQTTISLKASKKFGQASADTGADNSNLSNKNGSEELEQEKVDKRTSSSGEHQKDNDNCSEAKTKEDNMPLLVPEFSLNFDSSSDRDSSRSPPVITNQEEVEPLVEDAKITEGKVISQTEEVEDDKKHSYKDCEMTIADIITQLAYHEKATIKHKRYCNLCERWFPTTSRHRRHLAGYQHRYMELTQRKSIHALFILFTGKPCPRLLPANVIRSDCSIGELTPLQIAVQDVAKCVEYTQHDLKTKE